MQQNAMMPAGGRSSNQQLRLLCLDGGGVRGLSSLMVLKMVMEMIDPDNPPKPCDYFDMIGGTSTGGLIAIMLGRLQMGVQDCIDEYKTLFSSIFTKKKHRLGWRGRIQGRFDHEALEAGIKKIVGERLNDENALFKDNSSNGGCKSFVCATSASTSETVVMSSYYSMRRLNDLRNAARIWEVGRATSAATSFFDPIEILGSKYLDGGTGANNPVNKLWAEAEDAFRQESDWRLEDNLHCLVSIGTGQPLLQKFGDSILGTEILDALVNITTNTEAVANDFQQAHARLFEQGIAYRFNVEQGLESVALEDAESAATIEEVTRRYLSIEKSNAPLRRCVSRLKNLEDSHYLTMRDFQEHTTNSGDWTPLQETDADLCFVPHTTSYSSWAHGGGILAYQKPTARVGDKPLTQLGANILAYVLSKGDKTFLSQGAQPKLILYHDCSSGSSPGLVLSTLCLQLLASPISKDARIALSTALFRDRDIESRGDQRSIDQGTLRNLPVEMLQSALLNTLPHLDGPTLVGIDNLDALFQKSASVGKRDDSWRTTIITILSEWAQTGSLVHIVVTDTSVLSHLLVYSEDSRANVYQVHYDTELKECMSTMDFDRRLERQKEIIRATHGTTDWFWRHPTYISWRDKQSGILWVQGKPGSGKSVLARNILDPVGTSRNTSNASDQKRLSHEIDAQTCEWYYSTRGGDELMAHVSLLRSLLYQLLSSNSKLFDHFKPVYRGYGPGSSDWITLSNMKQIFSAIANAGVSILCLIDAMDESEDDESKLARKHILAFLARTTWNNDDSRVKFLILSRPEHDIEGFFTYFQDNYDDLGVIKMHEANGEAIRIIVDVGIESLVKAMRPFELFNEDDDESSHRHKKLRPRTKLPGRNRWRRGVTPSLSPKDQNELEKVRHFLLSNAVGVILWVTVCIATVKAMMGTFYTWQQVRQCLEALPTDLNDLYKRIVHDICGRLNAQELQLARRILMWTAGANTWHPLRIVELLEAIAIPKTGNTFQGVVNLEWEDFRYRLRRYCGPFIDIIRAETAAATGDQAVTSDNAISPFDRVQLLHRTAKDFLASHEDAQDLSFREFEAKQLVLDDFYIYHDMLQDTLRHSYLYDDADILRVDINTFTKTLASSLNDRGLMLHLLDRRSTLPGPKFNAYNLLVLGPMDHIRKYGIPFEKSWFYSSVRKDSLDAYTIMFFGQCVFCACMGGHLTAIELLLRFSSDIANSRENNPPFFSQIIHALLLASVKLRAVDLSESLANMSLSMLNDLSEDSFGYQPTMEDETKSTWQAQRTLAFETTGKKKHDITPHRLWLRHFRIPGTDTYANHLEMVAAEAGSEDLLKIIMGHTEAILAQCHEVCKKDGDQEILLNYARQHSLKDGYESDDCYDSRVAIEMGIDHLKSTFGGLKVTTSFLNQISKRGPFSPSLTRKIRRATSFYHRSNRTGTPRLDRISLIKKYVARWKRAVIFKDDYKTYGMVSVVKMAMKRMRRTRTNEDHIRLVGWDGVVSAIIPGIRAPNTAGIR